MERRYVGIVGVDLQLTYGCTVVDLIISIDVAFAVALVAALVVVDAATKGTSAPGEQIACENVGCVVEAGVYGGDVKGVGNVNPRRPEPGAGWWFKANGWPVIGDVTEQSEDEVAAGRIAGENDLVRVDFKGFGEISV